MSTLPLSAIAALLEPYLDGQTGPPPDLYAQLTLYLDILMRWNQRTNLTAIRSPEEIVRRHFGESLFAGLHLPASGSLLDLGSGAGFPGLPIQLLRPSLSVTLAESQNKKASFLREVIRTLNLPTQVWAARAELMPPGSSFDMVSLRAVDRMEQAIQVAAPLARHHLLLFTTAGHPPPRLEHFISQTLIQIPGSQDGRLLVLRRATGSEDALTP